MAKKKQKFSGLADFLDEDQPGQIVVEFNLLDEKTKRTIELQDRLTDIPLADRPIDGLKAAIAESPAVDLDVKIGSKKSPVQDPYKTRVNTVQKSRQSPVQDPYKTRVNEKQAFEKPVHQPVYDPVQDPYKTRVNTVQKNKNVQTLTGKQKLAFFYLLSDAKENGSSIENGDRITSQIPSAELTRSIQTKNYEATRSVTNALKKASLIGRHKSKDGPGGWTIYRIFKPVYFDGLNHLTRINPTQDLYKTRVNPVHQPVHQPVQTSSSSSRDLYLKESTTTQPGVDKSDWLTSIDLVAVQASGVTHSVLIRCLELYPNLEPEKLEQLVFRFGQYLKDPKHKIQNARGFFISLAEQLSKGQTPLDHIETPEDRALRELVSRQDEVRVHRAELEAKAFEFEFESWRDGLSVEDRTQLAPENSVVKAGSVAQDMLLKKHFREELWPERRLQILKSVEVSL